MSIAILFERQELAEELILVIADIFSPLKPESLFIFSRRDRNPLVSAAAEDFQGFRRTA